MTGRRIVDAAATWALCRRTTHRHFLLNPDEAREMEQVYGYCLAYIERRWAHRRASWRAIDFHPAPVSPFGRVASPPTTAGSFAGCFLDQRHGR